MKNLTKIFMAVVAGMLAFSCVTDATEDLGIQLGSGANGAGQTELTLSLEESRTFLGEKAGDFYPLYWSESDQVSVNGTSYTVAVSNENKAIAVLSGVAEATEYCIAYPAAPADQVIFAEKQNHLVEGSTFADGVSTMYGYSEDGLGVTLKHLTGVLKFGITGNAVLSKLQVSTIDRAPIAGTFDLNFQSGELKATTASKDVIEYSFGENGLQLTADAQYIHVAVPAGQYDELYITLYEQGNSGNIMYATVQAGESKPLTAGNVREFKSAIPYAPNAKLFVIDSAEKLAEFKAAVEAEGGLDMDAVLTEDIDMSGVEWTPIEGYSKTIIGNGYAIKGLTAPLFGDTHASFKGLHLEDVNITSGDRDKVGALACHLTATDAITPVVKNCSVSGTITINTTSEEVHHSRHGSLVGCSEGTTFDGCVNNATFIVSKFFASTSSYDVCIGGICGWLCEFVKSDSSLVYGMVQNCTNNGAITSTDTTSTIATLYAGGIIGSSKAANIGAKLLNNTNNAPINLAVKIKSELRFGGIMGYVKGTSSQNDHFGDNNINNGKLTVKAGSSVAALYFGGIGGNTVRFSYTNCHNYGEIELEEGAEATLLEIGGINGRSLDGNDTTNSHIFKDCTNNAPINVNGSMPEGKSSTFRIAGITGYTQGEIYNVTNNKEGTITINGNLHTNGSRSSSSSPKNGSYLVCGICGYKTLDDMKFCYNYADIVWPGDITELHASKKGEVKVCGIVGYTAKDGSDFVSEGTINLSGTYGCEMQASGSIGFHYNTLSGDEQSNTDFELSGTFNGGLVVGGVVGWTYVKVSGLQYNGTINITKDASISTLCYIGGCIGSTMSMSGTPSSVYLKDSTNNGTINVNGTINCTPYIGGVAGCCSMGDTTEDVYTLSGLVNEGAVTVGASIAGNNVHVTGGVGYANCSVTSVTNKGAVNFNGVNTDGNSYIAGCVANAPEGRVMSGLQNEGAINCSGSVKTARLGGCAGYIREIEQSTNTGSVTFTGTASTDAYCCGITYYTLKMKNCVNGSETDSTKGKLELNSETHTKVMYAGGLAREIVDLAEDCVNYGSIYLSKPAKSTIYLGGMIAAGDVDKTTTTTLRRCTNNGHIYVNANVAPTANANCFIGGFTYRNLCSFAFENCTNNGDIILKDGIIVGNAIRLGGFIGTMETNKNVTFDNCTNTGDIVIPATVVCGNTTSSTTGYIRAGGIVGNQSDGTITVKNTIKNTGKMDINGTSKHTSNSHVGGVIGYTSKAFTAESNAVLINEGEVICTGDYAKGLRIGGVIGQAAKAHPATVHYINTGNVTVTATFANATEGGYVGGVFGSLAASQSNAQCFCEIKADRTKYTGVGFITGALRTSSLTVTNSKLGGIAWTYNSTRDSWNEEPVADEFHNFIYGGGEDTDWTGTENYDGCSPLEKKEDIVVPTISIPETPEEEGTTEA